VTGLDNSQEITGEEVLDAGRAHPRPPQLDDLEPAEEPQGPQGLPDPDAR
jgi:hypothetical protein